MKWFSFYHPTTGALNDRQFYTSDPTEEAVRLNTPEGHVAIEGRHDHRAMMVDLSDPKQPKVIERPRAQ